jgi:hypothetical protein
MTFPHLRGAVPILMVLAISQLLAPTAAHAYLDPASGSLIVQVLIATVLGVLVGFKRIWFAITDFFRRLFGRGP